jgi:hypothetical protein
MINFVKTPGPYQLVMDSMIDPILPHLLCEYKFSTECEIGCLNVVFFAEDEVKLKGKTIFLSHGIADKNYRNAPRMQKFDYVFVSGPAWVEKMAREGMPEDKVFMNGYTKLDPIFQGEYTKASGTKKVLWAPTHGWFKNGSFIESAIRQCGFEVLISPHPANNNMIPTMQPLVDADVVVTDAGSIIYEAMALDKPVVFPSWLTKANILCNKAQFECQIYNEKIGYHASSEKDMLQKIFEASQNGITVKEQQFIEGILPKALRGNSGKMTAYILMKLEGWL